MNSLKDKLNFIKKPANIKNRGICQENINPPKGEVI